MTTNEVEGDRVTLLKAALRESFGALLHEIHVIERQAKDEIDLLLVKARWTHADHLKVIVAAEKLSVPILDWCIESGPRGRGLIYSVTIEKVKMNMVKALKIARDFGDTKGYDLGFRAEKDGSLWLSDGQVSKDVTGYTEAELREEIHDWIASAEED